jgi:uncharacterized metal-binding protein
MNGIPGIILLQDLRGAMRLDGSKDMSVHVSACTSYDCNTSMPVVEVRELVSRVFLRLVAKMEARFSEQRINIKFCVKLGNNASDTCAVLSKAYGGQCMKTSRVFERYKRFNEKVEDNEDNAHHFLRYQGYCSL